MDSTNETLVDEFLRHQIYIERFKRGQLQDLNALLKKLMNDVSAKLGQKAGDVGTNVKRLQDLLKDLQAMSDDVAKELQRVVIQQGKDLAQYEQGWTLGTLKASIPVAIDFNTVSPTLLWAAINDRPFEGRYLQEWFKDYTQAQKNRITQQVRMGVIEGETVDQLLRRIRGTQALSYKDGVVMGITRRSAEALARTTVAHITQTARQASFDANTDVIKALKWHSTLDSRTSLICQARDGKIYALDEGPRPPAHPNCRSTMVPVVKSWQELGLNLKESPPGTRASLNGQVPATLTYAEWLKKQPASFQDDVLGATKGKLFRQGKLTIDQFVDEQTGHAYTLDELKQRHPDAFST